MNKQCFNMQNNIKTLTARKAITIFWQASLGKLFVLRGLSFAARVILLKEIMKNKSFPRDKPIAVRRK